MQRCQTVLRLRYSVPVQNKAEDHPENNSFEAQSRGFDARGLRFPIRLLYTGKARFRVRGLAFPDGFQDAPFPRKATFGRFQFSCPPFLLPQAFPWRDIL